MLTKAIEAIENPVERFVAQLKALDNGVSERVTRMLLSVPEFHYTKLNLHLATRRNDFVGQVAWLDGINDYVTSALNVYVSNNPHVQLRDMLNEAVESLRPQHTIKGPLCAWAVERWQAEVANRPLQNVHRATLDQTWRQVIRFGGGDDVALVGPVAAAAPLGADDLSAFSTNELIHELQERSTYSVVLLDDEEGSNIFNWHGEAHVAIGAMELTKAAILKPILEKQ